jgi:hypothetical protein
VQTAKNEPQRYGKHGELLIDYEHTEHLEKRAGLGAHVEKPVAQNIEHAHTDKRTESGGSSSYEKKGEDV